MLCHCSSGNARSVDRAHGVYVSGRDFHRWVKGQGISISKKPSLSREARVSSGSLQTPQEQTGRRASGAVTHPESSTVAAAACLRSCLSAYDPYSSRGDEWPFLCIPVTSRSNHISRVGLPQPSMAPPVLGLRGVSASNGTGAPKLPTSPVGLSSSCL